MRFGSPMSQRRAGRGLLLAVAAALCASWALNAPPTLVVVAAAASGPASAPAGDEKGFFTKVAGAAAQGAVAAVVAAFLSAFTEPVVNRILVERCTVSQAIGKVKVKDCASFFLTTFPTNMLKFPVFEVINMLMKQTSMSGQFGGMVSGALFCTIMLPVTNYRFRKSMKLPIEPALLYQAYPQTVCRDIGYGWARSSVGPLLAHVMPMTSFVGKAFLFGLTVFFACIISAPFNEWRGYTLQPPNKKLPFSQFFKPVRFLRSTSVGATIMGLALFAGNLLVPPAEALFAYAKSHLAVTFVVIAAGIAIIMSKKKN